MAFNFKDFIIGNLPTYFIEEDSYKNAEGKGLLQRYLGIFGAYLDEEIYPQINDYLNIIDSSIAEGKFLNHISDVLGNPPDVFKNEMQYRNLLSYIVSVYKIKGTKDAYELFFGILGFIVEIEEIEPYTEESEYDTEGEYDKDLALSIYDQNRCQPCSTYNLKFYYKDNNQVLEDSYILTLLEKAIEFNEPINANLGSMTMILNFYDSIEISAFDLDVSITLEEVQLYDTDGNYDEGQILPTNIILSSSDDPASSSLPSSTYMLDEEERSI